jgi:acyl carrier protein
MWDERFENLLRDHLPFLSQEEVLTPDTGLRDLGLDSMGTVELLSVLENAYDVRFVDEALTAETFETPSRLWSALSAMSGTSAR